MCLLAAASGRKVGVKIGIRSCSSPSATLVTLAIGEARTWEGWERGGQDPEPREGSGPALCWVGGAMARQCAIVVQRCAQAREGEEEGGVLGQLGESIILWESSKIFRLNKVGAHSPWLGPDGFVGQLGAVCVTHIGCDALGRE